MAEKMDEVYLRATEKIRNMLREAPDTYLIKKIIYNALISNPYSEKLAVAITRQDEADYLSRINSLNFSDSYMEAGRSPYVIISPKYIPHRQLSVVDRYRIQFKEYFTFYPVSKDFNGAYKEIIKFLDLMPELSIILLKISQESNDYIKFKFPYLLSILLKTSESLAIYYSNQKNSSLIRKKVEKHFRHHGLLLKEGNKKASGFDLVIGDSSKTYTSIISEIVAREIVAKKNKILEMNLAVFVSWLKKEVKKIGELTPHEVHKLLG